MKLILHAPNIHQGGGRTLLLALLAEIEGYPCTALLDERLELPETLTPGVLVLRVAPSVPGRLAAEWTLRRLVSADDVVLCLGNLPPLFSLRGTVKVFVQNRYLLARRSLAGMRRQARLRIAIERVWLRSFLRRAEILVQTPSMQREVAETLRVAARAVPFFLPVDAPRKSVAATRRFDFLYVASGEPHKNHRTLVEAWCLLAADGVFPSLRLTLDPSSDRSLLEEIQSKTNLHRLRIENLGSLSSDEIGLLYADSGALIYPSLFESFGLPLLEAKEAGLPVVAAELDYVRDVVAPEQTFDPHSPVSIARAVRRLLRQAEPPVCPLSPGGFLRRVVQREEKAGGGTQ